MRRLFAILMLLVGVLAGSSLTAPVTAQGEATPTATSSMRPVIGDTVEYITESGSAIGEVTVVSMEMGWEGFDQYSEPSPGTEYVLFVVEVTNLGSRGSLNVLTSDFLVQDADGFIATHAWIDASGQADVALSGPETGVAPGETRQVVMAFQVVSGVTLTNIFWQPDYTRLITLAELDR